MPHGSKHPDSRDGEKMCPHCGGWYDSRGWNTHLRSCDRQGDGKKANFSPERPPSEGGKGDPNSQDDEQQGSESKPSPESNSGLGLGGDPPQEDPGSPRASPSSTPRPTDVDEPTPTVDELPERFVAVETFVSWMRRKDENGDFARNHDIDEIERRLSEFDVVDQSKTNLKEETISALNLSEAAEVGT